MYFLNTHEDRPMQTKEELAKFLRDGQSETMSVPHKEMVDIFGFAVANDTVEQWLKAVDLDFEVSQSATTADWNFRRKKISGEHLSVRGRSKPLTHLTDNSVWRDAKGAAYYPDKFMVFDGDGHTGTECTNITINFLEVPDKY